MQHLRVLAKLCSQRKRHERAAQVYELLATRHSGLGDAQVSLVLRVADYDNAIMQVCILMVVLSFNWGCPGVPGAACGRL